MLSIEDFKSDYQHLIVRGAKDNEVSDHIDLHYFHIRDECKEYINKLNRRI